MRAMELEEAEEIPQSDQTRVKGSGRRKVALGPGYSQLDWLRNSRRLSQPLPREISQSELERHATRDSAWVVVRGRVYDVTPYLKYHPGGVEKLMSGAGKDATRLFDKYHSWVNIEFLMERCFLGYLEPDEKPRK